MKRARHKQGSVVFNRRNRTWHYLWCENGHRRSKLIGSVREYPTKAAAWRVAEACKIVLAPFTPAETLECAKAVFGEKALVSTLAEWLYEKTLGHPYFLAFISRELLALPNRAPSDVWHEIATHLEREKFNSDLAHLSGKDVALLRALARADEHEVSPTRFVKQFQYEYFRRLTERGHLIRSGRGRYKLYHPLFRQFLQQPE